MKTVLAFIAVIVIGLIAWSQAQQVVSLLKGQGRPTMTHQELFDRTVEVFREVPFIREIPCTIDPDYRYSACFGREEGKGQNELNALLPALLEKRGLKFNELQSGESTSGGTVYAPGLEPYRVGVTINEYEVSLWMSGTLINLGAVESADGKYDVERFAYKSLRDASSDIAMRLLGSAEVSRNRVACQPSSEHAYCITTTKSGREILDTVVRSLSFSSGQPQAYQRGYVKGEFSINNIDADGKTVYSKISFEKKNGVERYTLFNADYKRKNFRITYSPSSSEGENTLRVEASWIDGYTPPSEER